MLLSPIVLVAACRGTPMPQFEPAQDQQAARSLRERYPAPQTATTTQRWILATRGSEFFFTLYVAAQPPHELRVAAVSDLGTTLMEATCDENGVVVVRESSGMDARMIEDLLLYLRALFLGPAPEAALVRLADARLALHGGHALYLPQAILVGRDGRQAGLLTIEQQEKGRARTFRIDSHTRGYTATAEIVGWEAE